MRFTLDSSLTLLLLLMKIEKVYMKASKIPYGFLNVSYEERFKRLKIISLKDRRVRGDLIEMYKVIRSLDEIEWTKSPLLRVDIDLTGSARGMRGNRLRLLTESLNRNNFARSAHHSNKLQYSH